PVGDQDGVVGRVGTAADPEPDRVRRAATEAAPRGCVALLEARLRGRGVGHPREYRSRRASEPRAPPERLLIDSSEGPVIVAGGRDGAHPSRSQPPSKGSPSCPRLSAARAPASG